MGKLTALKVKHAGPGRHGDGDGLFLVVSHTKARKWVLRVQANGKRRDIGLGSGSVVALADAREAAQNMRRAIKQGGDPVVERRRARRIMPTFRDVAILVHGEHLPGWRNKKHAAQWLSSLEAYAFPRLGNLPIDQIDGPMVRDVLAEIWLGIPETARRVRQRIGTVLDYAHAKGWRDAEAPMRSVSRGLPRQPKTKQHLAAMPWQEAPTFVANIADTLKTAENVRLALEFLIFTAARSGEVRGAQWSEIDFDNHIWTVPGERMKAGKTHRVPLSPRAIQILKRMKGLRRTATPAQLIFEGQRPDRPLSDMSLTMPLRRAGVRYTVHGFRSTFRDWCAEEAEIPREVAEACLAHTLRNPVEAAYARTDHLERRRDVMRQWHDFLISETLTVQPNRNRR